MSTIKKYVDAQLNDVTAKVYDILSGMDSQVNSLLVAGASEGGKARLTSSKAAVASAIIVLEEAIIRAGGDRSKIEFVKEFKVKSGYNNIDYLEKIDPVVANHIIDNLEDYDMEINVDLAVMYNGVLLACVEVKTYCEMSMFKRLSFEFKTVKEIYPMTSFIVFQLENALGGDYAEDRTVYFGSPAVHAVNAKNNIIPKITTLIGRNRKSTEEVRHVGYKHIDSIRIERIVDDYAVLFSKQMSKKHVDFAFTPVKKNLTKI